MPTPDYLQIELTQNQIARVSFARIDTHPLIVTKPWYAAWTPIGRCFYAATSIMDGGVKRRLYLHRYLLDLGFGDKREGDHVNPKDTLDNRDENIRILSRLGQTRNQTKRRHNTSGFKGVTKNKRGYKWRAMIGVNYKRIFIGDYYTPEEAARAYDAAAIRYFGESAHLNFPRGSDSVLCQ